MQTAQAHRILPARLVSNVLTTGGIPGEKNHVFQSISCSFSASTLPSLMLKLDKVEPPSFAFKVFEEERLPFLGCQTLVRIGLDILTKKFFEDICTYCLWVYDAPLCVTSNQLFQIEEQIESLLVWNRRKSVIWINVLQIGNQSRKRVVGSKMFNWVLVRLNEIQSDNNDL